jgi:hypothetical protein
MDDPKNYGGIPACFWKDDYQKAETELTPEEIALLR